VPTSNDLVRAPRFIYITGCDGTGKTTQARLLMEQLGAQGRCPVHVWLRFPFLFSLPLLMFARWRGYSWHEDHEGVRHGYWDFRSSWLLRTMLPWLLLIDAWIAAVRKIYLPLWRGRTIVCERFALDMLVDLAVAFGDDGIHRKLPGRLYKHLIPRGAIVAVLDLDAETARVRRPDLQTDHRLELRLTMFRQICQDLALPMLASTMSVSALNCQITEMSDQA
jgi:thymidylate kinase